MCTGGDSKVMKDHANRFGLDPTFLSKGDYGVISEYEKYNWRFYWSERPKHSPTELACKLIFIKLLNEQKERKKQGED